MSPPAGRPTCVAFGRFELDLRTGELIQNGERTPLQPKVFELLAVLLDRPGDVVTRDELRARLWPSDTYVGFDDSINHAVRKLRECLGDSADHPVFVETIPRHGYRFVAPVSTAPEGEPITLTGTPAAPLAAEPAGASASQAAAGKAEIEAPSAGGASTAAAVFPDARRVRPLRPGGLGTAALVASGLLLLAAVVAALWVWIAWPDRSRERRMLAVLPIDNLTGSADQAYLSDGLTEELTSELSRLNPSALGVIARSSAARFKDGTTGVAEFGRQLGVDYVVEGSVRSSGDRLRITLQLIRVDDESHVWSQQYDRAQSDILSIQRDVAERTAAALAVTLLPDTARRLASADAHPVSPAAREAYLRGRYLMGRGTGPALVKANEHLLEAVRLEPDFAPAHSALANSWLFLGNYSVIPFAAAGPKAKAAAEQALRLDPSEPQAHLVLAGLEFEHEWDFAGAERAFLAALEERPTAQAHQWYSALLSALGRFDEGIAQIQQARALDPLSPRVSVDLGRAYYFAHRFDQAIAEYRKVIELEPSYSGAHSLLGLALLEAGRHEEGVAALERGLALLGGTEGLSSWLGYGYALAGRREDAERTLARQRAYWEKYHAGAYGVALTYVGLGDADRAFEWLDEAFRERSAMSMLKAFAYWDRIRSDPRFLSLLRRVGLEP